MSETKRGYYDELGNATASVAPTNQEKNTEPVPAGYIRYADGTLEKFDEEEIWGDALFVPTKKQQSSQAVTNA